MRPIVLSDVHLRTTTKGIAMERIRLPDTGITAGPDMGFDTEPVDPRMAMRDGARRIAPGYAATGGAARGTDLIEQRLLTSSETAARGLA